MKIAVAAENGEVFQHFGKTKQFGVFTVEDGEIASFQVLDASENGHGALAGLLKQNGVAVVICGGIGQGAKDALRENGVELLAGASGSIAHAVKEYLDGRLVHDHTTCGCHHGHDCGGHH